MRAFRRSGWSRTHGIALLATAVGLVAAAIRIRLLLSSGVLALGGYDDGVHMAVAANLVHGRLPYRDVLFLQPPGMALAAAPFALLAESVGDAGAFVVARLTFAVLGALNAALVVLVARRLGVVAAVTGGALYAASFPAVFAERTLTLEVLGTTGLLVALLLLGRAGDRGRPGLLLLAGAAAGATVGVKIWYVVPFAVLLLGARGGRLRFLAGGVAAAAAICLPFFVAEPARMWEQVVLAQLTRPDDAVVTLDRRVRAVLGVTAPGGGAPLPPLPGEAVGAVLAVVALALVVLAATDRRAVVLVALLAATSALLVASPSFFQHYAALTAAPLALVAAAGVQRAADLLPGRWPPPAMALLAVVLAFGLNARFDGSRQGTVPPVQALRAAVAQVGGCVVADDPTPLGSACTSHPRRRSGVSRSVTISTVAY